MSCKGKNCTGRHRNMKCGGNRLAARIAPVGYRQLQVGEVLAFSDIWRDSPRRCWTLVYEHEIGTTVMPDSHRDFYRPMTAGEKAAKLGQDICNAVVDSNPHEKAYGAAVDMSYQAGIDLLRAQIDAPEVFTGIEGDLRPHSKAMFKLAAILESASDDEASHVIDMALLFARKVMGEGREHGVLDLETDKRTVTEIADESLDEGADMLFYLLLLKKKLARGFAGVDRTKDCIGPYGFCPRCGIESPPKTSRERRPFGDTTCGGCGEKSKARTGR